VRLWRCQQDGTAELVPLDAGAEAVSAGTANNAVAAHRPPDAGLDVRMLQGVHDHYVGLFSQDARFWHESAHESVQFKGLDITKALLATPPRGKGAQAPGEAGPASEVTSRVVLFRVDREELVRAPTLARSLSLSLSLARSLARSLSLHTHTYTHTHIHTYTNTHIHTYTHTHIHTHSHTHIHIHTPVPDASAAWQSVACYACDAELAGALVGFAARRMREGLRESAAAAHALLRRRGPGNPMLLRELERLRSGRSGSSAPPPPPFLY